MPGAYILATACTGQRGGAHDERNHASSFRLLRRRFSQKFDSGASSLFFNGNPIHLEYRDRTARRADYIVKLEQYIADSAGRKDTLSRQDVGFILSPERGTISPRSSFEEVARYSVPASSDLSVLGKSIPETICS